jgi:hypothetical protein
VYVSLLLNYFKNLVVTTDSAAPYNAVVLAFYNYYPFGMLNQGHYNENSSSYRFGFNGMMRMVKVKNFYPPLAEVARSDGGGWFYYLFLTTSLPFPP